VIMVTVSPFITNTLFIAVVALSGWQHVRMQRPNPILNMQFGMMILGVVMMLVVTFCNTVTPWISLVFLLIAVAALLIVWRQNRMVPPRRPIE